MEIQEFFQQAFKMQFKMFKDLLEENNKELMEKITFRFQKIKEDFSGFTQINSFNGEDTVGTQEIKEEPKQMTVLDQAEVGHDKNEVQVLTDCLESTKDNQKIKEDFLGFTQIDSFNAEEDSKKETVHEQARARFDKNEVQILTNCLESTKDNQIIRQYKLLDIDQQERFEQIGLRGEIFQRDSVKLMLFGKEIQSFQIVYYEVKNDWIDLWKLVKRQIFEHALQFDTKD